MEKTSHLHRHVRSGAVIAPLVVGLSLTTPWGWRSFFVLSALIFLVLTYVPDFAGGRTATVTTAITVATGVGATVISASFGFLHEQSGFSGAFLILAALLALDILIAAMVPRLKK